MPDPLPTSTTHPPNFLKKKPAPRAPNPAAPRPARPGTPAPCRAAAGRACRWQTSPRRPTQAAVGSSDKQLIQKQTPQPTTNVSVCCGAIVVRIAKTCAAMATTFSHAAQESDSGKPADPILLLSVHFPWLNIPPLLEEKKTGK